MMLLDDVFLYQGALLEENILGLSVYFYFHKVMDILSNFVVP